MKKHQNTEGVRVHILSKLWLENSVFCWKMFCFASEMKENQIQTFNQMENFYLKFGGYKIIINYKADWIFKKTKQVTYDNSMSRRFNLGIDGFDFYLNFGCSLISNNIDVVDYAKLKQDTIKKVSTPDNIYSDILLCNDLPYYTNYYENEEEEIAVVMFRKVNSSVICSVLIQGTEGSVEKLLKLAVELIEIIEIV